VWPLPRCDPGHSGPLSNKVTLNNRNFPFWLVFVPLSTLEGIVYRPKALVNCVLGVVKPFVLLLVLSPYLSFAQGQYNFVVPPAYSGSGNLFVADFNGDGKPDLLSSDGTLQLGNGDGTFTTGTPVTGTPLAVADFNGDGKPDVLEQGTGTLLVLLGNGDGTFQAPISTNIGASLTGIAAGDLNGDGKADVVGVFDGNLLVYLSNGDGTFATGVSYSLGTTLTPFAPITLADFNGDKKTDLAVSIFDATAPGQEIVFLGNGDGTFQAGKVSAGVDGPESVVAGDFNGDGKLDLAISFFGIPSSGLPGVAVLLGNGDGTFQAPTVVISTDGNLFAADVNGDGKVDLVLQNFPGPRVSWAEIYLGNGDGTFSNNHSYFLSVEPFSSLTPVIADFNLDGKPDVAAGNYLMLGNGDGTFQGVGGLPLPFVNCSCTQLGAAVVGDFNKNAAPYVAAAVPAVGTNNNLYILSNDGTGTLALANTYTLQQATAGIATGDLNGDGNLDLVAVGAAGYSVLLGNGDGSFQTPVFSSLANSAGPYSTVLADFNSDGKLDLAIPAGNQTVAVLLGNGDGTFGAPIYTFDGNGAELVSADFNGDGKTDLAAAGASGIAILLGNGDGTFQTATFITAAGCSGPFFTTDLNGDGKPDLIGSCGTFLGNGNGTFTTVTNSPAGLYAIADVNVDGKPDVIGQQTTTAQCCGFYLGRGDGTFGAYMRILSIQSDTVFQFIPGFVLAADMTGAGKQDIIMGGGSIPGVFVLTNITTPVTVNLSATSVNFGSQNVGVGSQPITITVTDTGSLDLTISSIQITGANPGDFSQTNGCVTFPPAGSCNIKVTFTPTADGIRSAVLTITDNAANSPQSVRLSGTGTGQSSNLGLGVASGGSSSATVAAGAMATYKLSVGGAGFSGTASLTCTGAPQGANCSFPSGATMNVNGSSAATFNVTVSTTARSMAALLPGWTGSRSWLWAVVLIGAIILPNAKCSRRSTWRAVRLSPLLLVLLLGACGGGGGSTSSTNPTGTPAGTYSLTVTAISGSVKQSVELTLTVQ
jgi:hypothetical protein